MSASPPPKDATDAEPGDPTPDKSSMERGDGDGGAGTYSEFDVKEQDRWLPIANGKLPLPTLPLASSRDPRRASLRRVSFPLPSSNHSRAPFPLCHPIPRTETRQAAPRLRVRATRVLGNEHAGEVSRLPSPCKVSRGPASDGSATPLCAVSRPASSGARRALERGHPSRHAPGRLCASPPPLPFAPPPLPSLPCPPTAAPASVRASKPPQICGCPYTFQRDARAS